MAEEEKIVEVKKVSIFDLLKNVKTVINIERKVVVPEGLKFINNLRKEAKRQQAMELAQNLEEQARDINHLPNVPSYKEESELANSFEIIEE